MTRTDRRPAVYQLRVAGLLDRHWSPWFGGVTLISVRLVGPADGTS
jgi:hypothetical protein